MKRIIGISAVALVLVLTIPAVASADTGIGVRYHF